MNAIDKREIANLVQNYLSAPSAIDPDACDLAPDAKGAYALVMRLDGPVHFSRGRTSDLIAAGWYAYAGSAYGPGGLRARLRRHFRRDKALHWHVDHLTTVANRIFSVATEDGSECGIVARLMESGRFQHSSAGFGSSDCRTCRSHLLGWI